MATTTNNGFLKITDTANANAPWEHKVADAGTLTLSTAGKYVDRDIDIKVDAGTFSNVVSTLTKTSQNNPTITNTLSISQTGTTITTNIPPQDSEYITLTPSGSILENGKGKIRVKANAKATITKSGWVNEDEYQDSADEFYDIPLAEANFVSHPQYLPIIKKLSEDNATYELETTTTDKNKAIDNFKITIKIPEGYYRLDDEAFTTTFENILPDFTPNQNNDGLLQADYLLSGTHLYTDKGAAVFGTMVNYGDSASDAAFKVSLSKSSGSVNGGEGVTLDTTSNYSKGLQVSGSGKVSGQATISTGYYKGQTKSATAISSNTATKVIRSLSLSSDNELESITNEGKISTITNTTIPTKKDNTGIISTIINNGTISIIDNDEIEDKSTSPSTITGGIISTLSGTGTISSLTGSQTITTLSGTIDVNSADTKNGQGTIKFGSATFVDNGVIQEGSVEEEKDGGGNTTGKLKLHKGWISEGEDYLKKGAVSVKDESLVKPKIKYSISSSESIASEAISSDETLYYFTAAGSVESKGSYSAKVTVTPGHVTTSENKPISKELTIENVNTEKKIYLKGATFSADVSQTTMDASDNTNDPARPANVVPSKYEFKVTTPGYASANSIAQLTVFGGEYTWTTP